MLAQDNKMVIAADDKKDNPSCQTNIAGENSKQKSEGKPREVNPYESQPSDKGKQDDLDKTLA